MRDTFVKTLIEIAKNDKKVHLITGDLGFGVLKPYWEQLPDQFTNAGISEQNMTTMAAGMALEGKIVFTYSIGNFPTLRCLEQIRNDCAYHDANVKIVCIGGGFVYGALGMSHQATEDLAVMRALPNVTVMAPGDLVEARMATKLIYERKGTCYLRLGRGGEKQIHPSEKSLSIEKAIEIKNDGKVALFSSGAILDEVIDAAIMLEELNIPTSVYSFPCVKPIDKEMVIKCAKKYEYIFTIEEHNILGGFGGAVAENVSEIKGNKAVVHRIGISDEYCSLVGSQKYLRHQYGIDAMGIANTVRNTI